MKKYLPETASPNAVTWSSTNPTQDQLQFFEAAMQRFHARDLDGALELFQRAASGPSLAVAHTAKIHARMCEQRISQARPTLQSPDDLYHYAVSLLNQRRAKDAESHLRQAIATQPDWEHVHYALALCRAQQGDLEGSARSLSDAIRLEPKNRGIARNDPDFAEFIRHSPLRDLIFTEKKETE